MNTAHAVRTTREKGRVNERGSGRKNFINRVYSFRLAPTQLHSGTSRDGATTRKINGLPAGTPFAPYVGMTHMISSYLTHRLPPIAAAAVLTAISAIGCSGSPLASAPFAPSALPAMALSAETGEADAGATFGALGKGNDKGKGNGKDKDGTTPDGSTTTTPTVVEATGAVVTATGTCPAKTFTIGLHTITTNAATVYEDGLCADLIALADIEVSATTQTDGTLLATRVGFDAAGGDDDDDPAEDGDEDADDGGEAEDGSGNPHHGAGPHSGTVSMLRGTCPAVTFNLKGLRVSTTEATEFVSGAGDAVEAGETAGAAAVEATCEMLRPNVQVTVTGEPGTTSRTFVAATVTIVRTH
jgi:hypothetical protein